MRAVHPVCFQLPTPRLGLAGKGPAPAAQPCYLPTSPRAGVGAEPGAGAGAKSLGQARLSCRGRSLRSWLWLWLEPRELGTQFSPSSPHPGQVGLSWSHCSGQGFVALLFPCREFAGGGLHSAILGL